MADRWIRNALGHEPGWEMGDKEIPPLDAAIVMREILIAEGEEGVAVIDARKRFAGFNHAD